MLCIGVLIVLGLNALISISFLSVDSLNERLIRDSIAFLIGTLIICFCWLLLKDMVQKNILAFTNKINYTQLKRNPVVFNGLLAEEELKSINLPQEDEAICFGNPSASIQVTMACNPYCGPCAEAHQVIEELLQKFPERLFVTIRFNLRHNDSRDKKVAAAIEIIKAAKHKPYDAIKHWYQFFDIKQIRQLHQNSALDISDAIEKQIAWSSVSNIKVTPTFFINGRKSPNLYNWKDCTEFLELQMNEL